VAAGNSKMGVRSVQLDSMNSIDAYPVMTIMNSTKTSGERETHALRPERAEIDYHADKCVLSATVGDRAAYKSQC